MIVEVVDTEANIERVMPRIDAMVEEGLVTLEPVRVVRYAASRSGS